MANGTMFAWADSLAYFFARRGAGLGFKIFGRHMAKKKDIEENLKLLATMIRNMHKVGILDDDDVWKLMDYSLKIIISGKGNPVETERFLLLYVNECLSKYTKVELSKMKELFREARLLSQVPVIKER